MQKFDWRPLAEARLQIDDLPAYRLTTEVTALHGVRRKADTAYVIESQGLSVTRGRSVSFVPWESLRFLHLHVTSGVGGPGFPVYSARIRTLFVSREITSLEWRGETAVDRSTDYVRFMETLIPFAAVRNPKFRLRYAGDPMMEGAIPMILTSLVLPLLLLFPLLIVKLPLGSLAVVVKKPLARLVPWFVGAGFGVVLNAFPWSSGKPFKAHDLPVDELPLKYRAGGV